MKEFLSRHSTFKSEDSLPARDTEQPRQAGHAAPPPKKIIYVHIPPGRRQCVAATEKRQFKRKRGRRRRANVDVDGGPAKGWNCNLTEFFTGSCLLWTRPHGDASGGRGRVAVWTAGRPGGAPVAHNVKTTSQRGRASDKDREGQRSAPGEGVEVGWRSG